MDIVFARPSPEIFKAMEMIVLEIGCKPVLIEKVKAIPPDSKLIIISSAVPDMRTGTSGSDFVAVLRSVREVQEDTPIVLTTSAPKGDWLLPFLKGWNAESRIVSTDCVNKDMLADPKTFVALGRDDYFSFPTRIARTKAMLKMLVGID